MSNLEIYQEAGFEGFKTIKELIMTDCKDIPIQQGVYMILRKGNTHPIFLQEGTGGYFKGKNPNVPLEELEKNWVEDDIVYIGKAGGSESSVTLQKRIALYMCFGQGKPVGHWGGRLIWQLADAKDLIVCWKVLGKNEEPREVEKEMIQEFKKEHNGKRPFANLQD